MRGVRVLVRSAEDEQLHGIRDLVSARIRLGGCWVRSSLRDARARAGPRGVPGADPTFSYGNRRLGRRAVRGSYSYTHAAPLWLSQVVVGFVTSFRWALACSSPYSV